MATVTVITALIRAIIRNDALIDGGDVLARMNVAVSAIAGGIVLPDDRLSEPLPDLYTTGVVTTTTTPYIALPDTYQRNVFYITDANGRAIQPLEGGDHYSFDLFLNSTSSQDLSEVGTVRMVAVKGRNLYYQGIPAEGFEEALTIHFYRKPVDMVANSDTPDGIDETFQIPLIKHYVCRDVFGDILEGAKKGRFQYHSDQFNKAMLDYTNFIGTDSTSMFRVSGWE